MIVNEGKDSGEVKSEDTAMANDIESTGILHSTIIKLFEEIIECEANRDIENIRRIINGVLRIEGKFILKCDQNGRIVNVMLHDQEYKLGKSG